jgi:hypothetical protein
MKFDYGEEVVLTTKDDAGNVGEEKRCWVVSITPVESEEQAKLFKHPIGSVLYTVEFGDGTDAFVPEADLRPLG